MNIGEYSCNNPIIFYFKVKYDLAKYEFNSLFQIRSNSAYSHIINIYMYIITENKNN